MGSFVGTALIEAPRERVFAYRLDVRTLPAYNPDVHDVREDSSPPAGAHSAWRFRLRLGPGWTTDARLVVVESAPPGRLVFEIDSLMRAREVCTFEEAELGAIEERRPGTRVRFETEVATPGGPLAPLVDAVFVMPNLRRQTARELDLMKRNLEAAASPEVPTP